MITSGGTAGRGCRWRCCTSSPTIRAPTSPRRSPTTASWRCSRCCCCWPRSWDTLHGNPHLQHEVLDSALAQFPVIGDQITSDIRSFHGSTAGLVIGMLGCVYGGLGIVQAVQTMLNKVWGVPRNSRPSPLRSRLRSLLLLAVGGSSVIVTTVLSALGAAAGSYGASLG